MSRIRSIHPGQWTDEDFVECGMAARLLVIGLRNEADDNGVFEWKPTRLTATHEAAERIARHELNNAKMRFRALVMLLKRLPSPPDGLTAILADIEAMEADQMRAEAAEKGAVSAAKINAAHKEC